MPKPLPKERNLKSYGNKKSTDKFICASKFSTHLPTSIAVINYFIILRKITAPSRIKDMMQRLAGSGTAE